MAAWFAKVKNWKTTQKSIKRGQFAQWEVIEQRSKPRWFHLDTV